MPVRLRPRLDCHYCGQRSKVGGEQPRKFQCQHCLAVNFLDENGEIADVPADEAAPAMRFARPVGTAPPQEDSSSSSQDSMFCSTCLKNQHLYTYNLSQYLPDPDHPDYDRLEEALPEYKKSLEERYPQCCPRCEPRVRAKLQQATYNARSDHLRRVLEKSRQRRIASRLGWRRLLVSAAGLGYFSSLVLQTAWHLYGSQISERSIVRYVRPSACLERRVFLPQCLEMTEPLVRLSLTLGLLCIWWNPQWQHKLANNDVSLAGLNQYYMVQFCLLSLRFGAWIVMSQTPFTTRFLAMFHAGSAVAIMLVAGWSLVGIVKVRGLTPVNWHEDLAPLLSKNQFVPPEHPSTEQVSQDQNPAFSVSNLAAPGTPSYRTWRPPTPPEECADSMDWTPSQSTFQPELKQVRYKPTGPSPFHGTLPALNSRGFEKNSRPGQPGPKEAIGLPPGFFDRPEKSALPSRQQPTASEVMAQPKFFGHDREADTGLENIFGTVFSLQDRSLDPPTSLAKMPTRAREEATSIAQANEPILATFSAISFFTILMAIVIWMFEGVVTPGASMLGYYIVLFSACVPVGHLVLFFSTRSVQGHFLRPLVLCVEAGILIGVARLREPFGELLRDLWNKLAMAMVALLLPQEFLQMNNSGRPPTSQIVHQSPSGDVKGRSKINGPSPPVEMPTLSRPASTDSLESQTSIATTSTAAEWQTPRPPRARFEAPPPSAKTKRAFGQNPRRPEKNMFGIDSLSLSDRDGAYSDPGPRTSHGTGLGSNWGLESSGSNIAGPRSRRQY